MAFRFEESFYLDRRHTACPGGRDRLSIGSVLDITSMEDAFDTGTGSALRDYIAIRVQFDLSNEWSSVRYMTDSNEEAVHILLPYIASLDISKKHPRD